MLRSDAAGFGPGLFGNPATVPGFPGRIMLAGTILQRTTGISRDAGCGPFSAFRRNLNPLCKVRRQRLELLRFQHGEEILIVK